MGRQAVHLREPLGQPLYQSTLQSLCDLLEEEVGCAVLEFKADEGQRGYPAIVMNYTSEI